MGIVPLNWGSFLKVHFVRLLWQSIDVIAEVICNVLSIAGVFRNGSGVCWKPRNKMKNVGLLELLAVFIDFLI